MGQTAANHSPSEALSEDLIAEYCERIRWLTDVDYGDFKRKVGMYLNRLLESGACSGADSVSLIQSLKNEVIYDPTGDIEATRARVILGLEKIRSK